MSARKNVPAAAVRAWFSGLATAPEGIPAPGSRGRLHPDTIAAFHKANKGLRYETGVAEAPTVEVPGVVNIDSAGRKTSKTVTITTREARELLGDKTDAGKDSKRGRFSKTTLALALSAQNADAVADQFSK